MKNAKNWKKLKKGIAIALAGVTLLSPISAVAENMLAGERGTGIERTTDEPMPADEQTGNGLEGGAGLEGEPGGSTGAEGGTGTEGEPGGSAGAEGGAGLEGEPGGSTGAEGGTGIEGEPGGSAGAEGGTEGEPDGSAGTEDSTEGQPEADADSEEEKVDENNVSSDGSLAGQTLKFVNLYWETDDLGELEAVFDGGADEAMVQYLTRQERGVYETTIPSGDYSRVSFRVAGSGQSLDQSTYNYYGVDMRDGETETCSFIPEKNNTFYYDMGENPSYWGTDPAYEVTDPEAPVTVLKEDTQPTMMRAPAADASGADDTVTAPETEQMNPQAGDPKPGDMVYAIDLDEREKYLAGQPTNTYRVHVAFMIQGHDPSIKADFENLNEDEGEVYTMYEKDTGVYSAPFPDKVKKSSEDAEIESYYSEIGFKLVSKENQEAPMNKEARHFNFRGITPEGQGGDQAKFGYFKYYSGYTDTYYMNSSQDDSYWGAHPSNADQSLDTQVMYINVEDDTQNNIIADPDNMWISWNGMPQGKEGEGNFDPEKGWKVTNTLPHKWIRYFQFPMNSNATENTILNLHFTLTKADPNKPVDSSYDMEKEYNYKFTLVPRSMRNRVNVDYIWEFNGKMWDHFAAGEGINPRKIFFNSVSNEYSEVWVRVGKNGTYADKDEINNWSSDIWTEDWKTKHIETDKDDNTWLVFDMTKKPADYNKEEKKLFELDIPSDYDQAQFRVVLDDKAYYSNRESISQEYSYPCYYSFKVGDAAERAPDADVMNPGITGYWNSVYAVNNAGDQSVNIPVEEMEWEEGVYYAETTFYDYYSDWEMSGRKINTWNISKYDQEVPGALIGYPGNVTMQKVWGSQSRLINAALEGYYAEVNNIDLFDDPQPVDGFPAFYLGANIISDTSLETGKQLWMNSANEQEIMSNKDNGPWKGYPIPLNRWTQINGGPFLGIVKNELSEGKADGELLLGDLSKDSEKVPKNQQSGVIMPLFNEQFLRGDNILETAVGNVYKDVKFPIKMDNTKDSPTEGYWVYDSSKMQDTFRMKYDVDEGYFMERTNAPIQYDGRYSFFPFNDASDFTNPTSNVNNQRSKINYMFGSRMEFPFAMPEANDQGKQQVFDGEDWKDITFEFQGDDDTWIFIDGKLVLDLGGIHDAVRGTVNLTEGTYEIRQKLKGAGNTFDGEGIVTKEGNVDAELMKDLKENPSDSHTLTIFYMERGLSQSNLKLTFNFPRENRLTVEKEVDLNSTRKEGEDDIFAGLLENMGGFNFNLNNLVTSGAELPLEQSSGYREPSKNTKLYSPSTEPAVDAVFSFGKDTEGDDTGSVEPKEDGSGMTVKQNSMIRGEIPKEADLLKVAPIEDKTLDVSEKDYLRLVMKNTGTDDRAAQNLYISFVDARGNRVGGYAGSYGYNGESNTFLFDQESVLRIDFKQMPGGGGKFDWSQLAYMLIGIRRSNPIEEAAYEISYASFFEQMEERPHIGFHVDDSQISDYGSYESGKLEPVDGVWYIKQDERNGSYDKGNSWTTEGGTFNLADDQRAVFTDKFRTGSYIELEETVDPKIFNTKWSLLENEKDIPAKYLLNTRQDITTVENPLQLIDKEYPLKDVEGTEIRDGRKEKLNPEWDKAGSFQHPDTSKTFIYRSYQDPDSSANIGTDLNVKVTNTLRRGSLTIKKQLDESMKDTNTGTFTPAEFTFKVYYTNIAGRALEKQLEPNADGYRFLEQTVTVKTDEKGEGEVTVHNIPAGSKYYVIEVPANGTRLVGITYPEPDKNNPDSHADVGVGGLSEDNPMDYKDAYFTGTAYASNQEVIFTNKMEEFYMDIQKIWKDGLPQNSDEREIKEVHIRLERKLQTAPESEPWEIVTKDYFGEEFVDKENYLVLTKDNGWKTTSTKALEIRDAGGNLYKYRIQELDYQGIFKTYDVDYDMEQNEDYVPNLNHPENKKLHITYRAINTPADLRIEKTWTNSEGEILPSRVRVKLLASADYNPGDSEKEVNWGCYKKIDNPNHKCRPDCYIELSKENGWSSSMKNLTKNAGSEDKPYYYKLGEEQILLDSGWVSVDDAFSGCKPTYGSPVTLELQESEIATVTMENALTMGSITLIKQGEDDKTLLKDAKFKIERLKPKEEAPDENDKTKWEVDESWESREAVTDGNGEIHFEQLPHGTYRITETKAPGGYLLSKEGIIITIPYEKANDLIAGSNDAEVKVTDEGGAKHHIVLTVKNSELYKLPSTGGPGIYRYMISGVALMIAAMFILYNKKYKKRRRRV